ncbi:hypothetical protein MtrunA17_Chr3g0108541 [Medicago truncatula]|uniref:Plant/F17O14-7 protein n=1 Tax=Medicago truncatula TaxID=3880 RepID=G7IV73_MEDTR|nr:uncharacterized protein LOC11426557 [Medicago truncatula]AES70824.1 plant/F17O14-7 protein [Medicago truncatula]RHN67965.1 hypothetical protein MtrunA17_Chr3g0108541 [Medicago truncatula]
MRVVTIFLAILTLPLFLSLPFSSIAQIPFDNGISSKALDSVLQNYAFKALVKPKTGVPYDAKLPNSIIGVKVSTLRLRSGSLRTRGVQYKEFQIPPGVVEQPYVERLVLVYHNLGNLSEHFYPLPGYTYLAPVLGLLSYSGVDLFANELPELDVRASDKPILVKFLKVKSAPYGSVPKCVYFDLHGSVQFDILLPDNVCSTMEQGHFSIVVESNAPTPAPAAVAAAVGKGGRRKSNVWIIVGSVVGGCILLIMLSLLVVRLVRIKKGMKIQELEWTADSHETLQMKSIGGTKAPLAIGTRTRPTIENDYIP